MMQRLAFPVHIPTEHPQVLPDGHEVQWSYPSEDADVEYVIARKRDSNDKSENNVYTRRWESGVWVYYDGMEFRHRQWDAHKEIRRRQEDQG